MNRFCYLLLIPVLALGFSGCAATGTGAENEEADGGSPHRAALPSYTSAEVTRGKLEGVSFDDASWEIPSSEEQKVEAAATYLKVRAERVIVAGGAQVTSPEYARQLGQQRAQAVKEALMDEGIPANKITTVSFGLDLPGKGGDRVEFGVVPTGEKAF